MHSCVICTYEYLLKSRLLQEQEKWIFTLVSLLTTENNLLLFQFHLCALTSIFFKSKSLKVMRVRKSLNGKPDETMYALLT